MIAARQTIIWSDKGKYMLGCTFVRSDKTFSDFKLSYLRPMRCLTPFSCHEDMFSLLNAVTIFVRAVAQDTTAFDPSSIDLATKSRFPTLESWRVSVVLCGADLRPKAQWCQGQTASCPALCGGVSQTKANSCIGVGFCFAQQYVSCVHR